MPTYEYACDNCGHEFERQQRITEKPLKKCPKCGKKTKMVYGRKGVQRTACCLVDMPQEDLK